MNRNLFTGLAKDTTDTLSEVSSKAVSSSFNLISRSLEGLFKFIVSRNVLTTAIGIMMATQISALTTVVSEAIITPILNAILGTKVKDLEKYEIIIFSIKFKVGLLISKLISFFLIVFVIYNIWKLSEIKINFSTPNTIKSADKIGINVSASTMSSDSNSNVGININTK
jgi:large conductance mechanosensitive channel